MNTLLSIVVPFYKEGASALYPLMSSISTQKGIDLSFVEVILSNDGYEDSQVRAEDFSLLHNLNVKVVSAPKNEGSGVARQFGLDHAVGKYVMFCDCDDLLHNVGVLGTMLLEMEEHGAEYLSTSWLEESVQEGVTLFVNHDMETTWLHGKMFLREFLVKENIRFHPELRVHEDTYYLSLVSELAQVKRHMPLTSYVWTFSPNSITRANNAIYSFESMDVFPKAVLESIKALQKRGMGETLEYKVIQVLSYIYLISESKLWKEKEAESYRFAMNQSMAFHMNGLWDVFEGAREDFINRVYWEEYVKSPRDFTDISFLEWVADLKKVGENMMTK